MSLIKSRTAIITGSGQGIGKRIAEDLAGRGFAVVIAERNAEHAHRVAEEICSRGGKALAIPLDITDSAAAREMVARAEAEFGAVDVFVSSARWSGLRPTPVSEISDEDWSRALDVNVTGTFNCVRAVVPGMTKRRYGRIIILSSATVTLPPMQPYVHYITTKAALIGMTRALARELGPSFITVNAVLPGSVETGVDRPGLSDEERRKRATSSQSLPEVIQPQDISGIVAFLTSDEARMITGQSFTVDGGRSFL
jgi:3-oxoacyl-[acyl-carrier protein] reductase